MKWRIFWQIVLLALAVVFLVVLYFLAPRYKIDNNYGRCFVLDNLSGSVKECDGHWKD